MIRLFAAIPAPEAAAEALAPLAQGLPGARWTPRANLHLTLRFAGDIPETVAEDLDSALSAVTAPAFSMTLAGVGIFSEGPEPRAVWAGVEAGEPLSILHGRCERAARQAGLAPDNRAWKPHVTLGYLRGADPARVAAWTQTHSLFRLPPFDVAAFGRDVARGAEDEPRGRRHGLLAPMNARDAEIQDLHEVLVLAATHEHHVLGLQVAVDDALRMRLTHRVG